MFVFGNLYVVYSITTNASFLNRHQLKERHDKGEEVFKLAGYSVIYGNTRLVNIYQHSFLQIMYFCFDFLKYIMSDDFSVDKLSSRCIHVFVQCICVVPHVYNIRYVFSL